MLQTNLYITVATSCSAHTVLNTSGSLVRSYSRPLSLNVAMWYGPSLNVTLTGARVIISPDPLDKVHRPNSVSTAKLTTNIHRWTNPLIAVTLNDIQ